MPQSTRLIAVMVALLTTIICASADDFRFDAELIARGECDSRIATLDVDLASLQELVGVKLKAPRWLAVNSVLRRPIPTCLRTWLITSSRKLIQTYTSTSLPRKRMWVKHRPLEEARPPAAKWK